MAATIANSPKPTDPTPGDPLEFMERGLDRLKQLTLERLEQMGVEAQPLKEMRLEVGIDVQIVYYDVHVPFAGGLNLRIPVLTTVMPRFYSPTRAQHL